MYFITLFCIQLNHCNTVNLATLPIFCIWLIFSYSKIIFLYILKKWQFFENFCSNDLARSKDSPNIFELCYNGIDTTKRLSWVLVLVSLKWASQSVSYLDQGLAVLTQSISNIFDNWSWIDESDSRTFLLLHWLLSFLLHLFLPPFFYSTFCAFINHITAFIFPIFPALCLLHLLILMLFFSYCFSVYM